MPSMTHEVLLLLFRNCPTLAAEILRDTLGAKIPAFAQARVESADLTEAVPRERRADQIVLLLDGEQRRLSIVVEAQLGIDGDKGFTWPEYLVGARSRYRCPACLLVVTTDPAVAAWSAEPIELGPGESVIRPFVLGPRAVPLITEPEMARAKPELAVLSAMAHGRSEAGVQVAAAALAAAAGLDMERATLYEDVVLSSLNEVARRALEAMMASGNYEIQTELVRKNVERGEAKAKAAAVLAVLETRELPISDEVRQRVLTCTELAALDRWLRRAVVVNAAPEIFDATS